MRRYKDAKSGKVFGGIVAAWTDFCARMDERCKGCPFAREDCVTVIRERPEEAAARMGMEVLDDEAL